MVESKQKSAVDSDEFSPDPVVPAAIASISAPLVAVPVLRDEEYATELTEPTKQNGKAASAELDMTGPINRAWGWSAITVAILSLFIMPIFFGSAGVSLGIIAFFRGNRSLGGWSMAISMVSIFTSLILVPYMA